MNSQQAGDMAEDLAAEMLGTTLGLKWTRQGLVGEGAGIQVERPVHQDDQYHPDGQGADGSLDHDGGDRDVPSGQQFIGKAAWRAVQVLPKPRMCTA